ncbi:MAG: hypothetical protein ABIH72_02555 [archaeon]
MKTKLFTFLLACLLVGTTSCATIYQIPKREGTFDLQMTDHNFTSSEDISISLMSPNQEGVEGLIETTEDYLDYLEFRQEYYGYPIRIQESLENNDFIEAHILVRGLADKLECDDNIYAHDYLERIKNFEYKKKVYYDMKIGRKTGFTDDFSLLDTPSHLLMTYAFAWGILFGEWDINDIPYLEEKEIIHKYYDEVQINPYSGKKTIIRERVKVE